MNGEVIEDYDEGTEYWCPRCERYHKQACRVDEERCCLVHGRPISDCREDKTPAIGRHGSAGG